jgi:hypothetical protein
MYACTGASPSAIAICGLPPARRRGFAAVRLDALLFDAELRGSALFGATRVGPAVFDAELLAKRCVFSMDRLKPTSLRRALVILGSFTRPRQQPYTTVLACRAVPIPRPGSAPRRNQGEALGSQFFLEEERRMR